MQNKTCDYLKVIDLNPASGSISDPRDDRSLCDFGFAAESQHLFLMPVTGGTNSVRVLYSFDVDHSPGGLPSLPMPGNLTPHGIFFTVGGSSAMTEARYERSHTRRSVRLWTDPATSTQPGQVIQVVIRAWAELP